MADLSTYLTCRGRCEVEAESGAYVGRARPGRASGYTVPYVAGGTGGDSLVWQEPTPPEPGTRARVPSQVPAHLHPGLVRARPVCASLVGHGQPVAQGRSGPDPTWRSTA